MNIIQLEEGRIKEMRGHHFGTKRPKSLIEPVRKFSWNKVGLSFEVKEDGKAMNKQVLESLSGSVLAGEVVGIMGSSGAGKSTLLNTLAGRIGPGILTGKFYP
jgi:ABC-type multidrug transport system ATPase subunit